MTRDEREALVDRTRTSDVDSALRALLAQLDADLELDEELCQVLERCAEAYDASIEAWRDASAAGSTCAASALLVDSWREPVDSPREAIRRADRYRGACAGSAEVGMLAHAIEASTRAREACRE